MRVPDEISHIQELFVLIPVTQLSFLFYVTVATAEYLLGWHASICEEDGKEMIPSGAFRVHTES